MSPLLHQDPTVILLNSSTLTLINNKKKQNCVPEFLRNCSNILVMYVFIIFQTNYSNYEYLYILMNTAI